MIQLGKFVGEVGEVGGVVADTNYLYPARWGWINSSVGLDQQTFLSPKWLELMKS